MSVTERDRAKKRGEIARALAKQGIEDVYVLDRESAREVLTDKRTEVLDALRSDETESVTELAKRLGRNKSVVSKDLTVLAENDLVEFVENGRRKVPRIKHSIVVAPV